MALDAALSTSSAGLAEKLASATLSRVTQDHDMVEKALTELGKRVVFELDAERKAAMVSNLMVVLCGESDAKPVINTGTLYG